MGRTRPTPARRLEDNSLMPLLVEARKVVYRTVGILELLEYDIRKQEGERDG